jgi:hypothetical protein
MRVPGHLRDLRFKSIGAMLFDLRPILGWLAPAG